MDIKQLAQYLKTKLDNREVSAIELVVTLIAMTKDGKLNKEGIKFILDTVFESNDANIVYALTKANAILDEQLLDSIINDVHQVLH